MAHWTQTVFPGWSLLPQGSGAGALSGGGSYVAYYDPVTTGFTLTIVKLSGQPESATFQLAGSIASITTLNGWHSTVTKGSTDTTAYFNKIAPVTVTGGKFSINLVSGD